MADLDKRVKYFYRLVFILPASVISVFIAIANRHRVSFILDPFSPDAPALSIDLPLFAIVIGAIFIGMLIGGAVVWSSGAGGRKKARTYRKQIRGLEKEKDAGAAQAETPSVPATRPV